MAEDARVIALRDVREMITQSEIQCAKPDDHDQDGLCDGTQCLYCALLNVIDPALTEAEAANV